MQDISKDLAVFSSLETSLHHNHVRISDTLDVDGVEMLHISILPNILKNIEKPFFEKINSVYSNDITEPKSENIKEYLVKIPFKGVLNVKINAEIEGEATHKAYKYFDYFRESVSEAILKDEDAEILLEDNKPLSKVELFKKWTLKKKIIDHLNNFSKF